MNSINTVVNKKLKINFTFHPQTGIRRNLLQKQGKKKKRKKNRQKKKKSLAESHENETQDAQQNGGDETLQENDVECDFQAYWLEHGEFLVWQAWLEKYSDYVNTDMMDHVSMPVETEGRNMYSRGGW